METYSVFIFQVQIKDRTQEEKAHLNFNYSKNLNIFLCLFSKPNTVLWELAKYIFFSFVFHMK